MQYSGAVSRLRQWREMNMSGTTTDAALIDAGLIKPFVRPKRSATAAVTERTVSTGVELRIDFGSGIVLTIKRHY
jgi:hypothetical protein